MTPTLEEAAEEYGESLAANVPEPMKGVAREFGKLNAEHFKAGWCAAEQHSPKVKKLVEALVWADEMLTARDEMNSKVHCAPVRLSPLTERVKQVLADFRSGGG